MQGGRTFSWRRWRLKYWTWDTFGGFRGQDSTGQRKSHTEEVELHDYEVLECPNDGESRFGTVLVAVRLRQQLLE